MMFDVNAKFTINSGDNASFIFGANDPRLTSDFRNVYGGPGGENFIRFELDLSGVTGDPATNTGGVVNIYRKGYHETDDVNGDPNVMPYKSVRLVDSTAAAVKNLFTPGEQERRAHPAHPGQRQRDDLLHRRGRADRLHRQHDDDRRRTGRRRTTT